MTTCLMRCAPPRVSDVHETIGGLNNRRIRIFAGLAFEHVHGFPRLSVAREATFSGVLPLWRVIVNKKMPAVLQRDGVGAGARVRQLRAASPASTSARHRQTRSRTRGPSACGRSPASVPPACMRMLGWMASMGAARRRSPADATRSMSCRCRVLRSKCTRHVLGVCGVSVLLGAMMVPSASRTGLFLIGPRIPSGSRRASLHVRPSSADVRTMPHHSRGLGPTL